MPSDLVSLESRHCPKGVMGDLLLNDSDASSVRQQLEGSGFSIVPVVSETQPRQTERSGTLSSSSHREALQTAAKRARLQEIETTASRRHPADFGTESSHVRPNKLHNVDRTEYRRMLQHFLRTNKQICDPFLNPVTGVPGYYDVITSPMDFSTIRTKMENSVYTSRAALDTDILQIFHNALLFNPPFTHVFNLTCELLPLLCNSMRNSVQSIAERHEKLLAESVQEERAAAARRLAKRSHRPASGGASKDAVMRLLTDQLTELQDKLAQSSAEGNQIHSEVMDHLTASALSDAEIYQLCNDIDAVGSKHSLSIAKLIASGLPSAGRDVINSFGNDVELSVKALPAGKQRQLQSFVQSIISSEEAAHVKDVLHM